jgi:hypothetical protein
MLNFSFRFEKFTNVNDIILSQLIVQLKFDFDAQQTHLLLTWSFHKFEDYFVVLGIHLFYWIMGGFRDTFIRTMGLF